MSPWVPWEISSLPGGTRLKAERTWRGKQTTALFFQGPTRAPQDLPCLPDTSSAFLHTKNKPSAACGQQPAADVGQSPVSLDSGNARAACTGKGTGTQLGRSGKEQDPAATAGRSPGTGGGQHWGHHLGSWGQTFMTVSALLLLPWGIFGMLCFCLEDSKDVAISPEAGSL